MADYLMTIPEVTDGVELSSFQMGHDNKSVVITMAESEIASWLWQAAVEGRGVDFVGILGPGVNLALDNVYVSDTSMSDYGGQVTITATLIATEMRYVPDA